MKDFRNLWDILYLTTFFHRPLGLRLRRQALGVRLKVSCFALGYAGQVAGKVLLRSVEPRFSFILRQTKLRGRPVSVYKVNDFKALYKARRERL